jgi:hypothetical protein
VEPLRKSLNPVVVVLIAAMALLMMAAYGLTHLQPVPDVAPHYGDRETATVLVDTIFPGS